MSIKSYLNDAIRKGKAVTISYIKYDGEYSTRTISDIHYSDEFGEGDDYIDAFCHKRQERRTFKISRIISVDGITDTPVSSAPKQQKTAYTGNTVSNTSSGKSSNQSSPNYGTYSPRTSSASYKSSYSNGSSNSSYGYNYSKSSPKKNEGCYIATMVYGSYEHPQVMVLRQFRDTVLKTSLLGRTFISVYYSVSPKLVRVLDGHEKINLFIRKRLDKMVYHIHQKYNIN